MGTINRVGIEPLGDNDFYGQSYFVDPRGQYIGAIGDAHDEELLVRDMDLSLIEQVRQTWQFYRDRRPGGLRGPRRSLTPWAQPFAPGRWVVSSCHVGSAVGLRVRRAAGDREGDRERRRRRPQVQQPAGGTDVGRVLPDGERGRPGMWTR